MIFAAEARRRREENSIVFFTLRLCAPVANSQKMKDELQAAVETLGLEKFRRHIFLCVDADEPKCCPARTDAGGVGFFEDAPEGIEPCRRAAARLSHQGSCLRVCARGPVAVVYPEGVWYHSCTPEVLERIIQEHLVAGKIVAEFAFAKNPLG